MKRFFLSFVMIAGLLVAITPIANGIVNGKEIIGSDYVVTLLPFGKNEGGWCTGVYFSERVVVTAAHCVIQDQAKAPELRFPLDNFYVAQAGINWRSLQSKSNAVRVLKIWTEPDYFNRWKPDQNQIETQTNDVAFLFLEKPLDGKYLSRSANSAEIEDFKRGVGTAFHLGYGCTGGKDSSSLIYNGSPYRVDGIKGTSRTYPHFLLKERFLVVDYPTGTSLCPGDSGSPLLMQKGDEVIYLGTIFAGWGWLESTGNLNARGGEASVTVFWPFQDKLDVELDKFLSSEKAAADLKAKQEAEAKAAAELKAKQEAEAKAAADKAALAKAQSELVAANAALADAQKVNREQAARISAFEEQFKVLSDSVNTLQSQVSQLNTKLVAALSSLNLANTKIKKICASKPKPKGC